MNNKKLKSIYVEVNNIEELKKVKLILDNYKEKEHPHFNIDLQDNYFKKSLICYVFINTSGSLGILKTYVSTLNQYTKIEFTDLLKNY